MAVGSSLRRFRLLAAILSGGGFIFARMYPRGRLFGPAGFRRVASLFGLMWAFDTWWHFLLLFLIRYILRLSRSRLSASLSPAGVHHIIPEWMTVSSRILFIVLAPFGLGGTVPGCARPLHGPM